MTCGTSGCRLMKGRSAKKLACSRKTVIRQRQATRYSQDYVDQEVMTRTERLGGYAHDCVPAWEWRAVRRN